MTAGDVDRSVHLLLVRHGETSLNAEDRFQSEIDAPLSDVGRRQAEQVASRLAEGTEPDVHRWNAVHSSTALRARQTADVIAAPRGLPRLDLHEFVERRLGALDGMPRGQWRQRHPYLMRCLVEDDDYAPPGGESMRLALLRFVVGLRRSIRRAPPGTRGIVVVAHGGVLGALTRSASLAPAPGTDFRAPTLPGHCAPIHLMARARPASLELSTDIEEER